MLSFSFKIYQHGSHDSTRGQARILMLLQSRLVHSILVFNTVSTLPLLARLATGRPWPHAAAELVTMAINILIILVLSLTAASSVIKLVLVANFNLIFSQGQHKSTIIMINRCYDFGLMRRLTFYEGKFSKTVPYFNF